MIYSLRPATREDLPAMMAIGLDGIRPYVEASRKWDQKDQERQFCEHFTIDTVSIIQVHGHDAGYLKLEEHEDHLFLSGIYLGRDHRGKGTGSEVILGLIRLARSMGKPLRLRVHRPNPAQQLYERLGFRRTALTDTHVFMEFAPHDDRIRAPVVRG